MKFLSLKAKNFMSFKDIDYIFPDTGLCFVGGLVSDGRMSSSNGAGKSALFEALCYGLFGKTVRNAGKDDIINRTVEKNCFVEVIIEDDEGTYYVIHRYRKDDKWQNTLRLHKVDDEITGSDVHETQSTIDSILGMNWLVFSTAVVFGEKAKRFIEAGDAEKKEVFDEILMLHYYQEAQQAVKKDFSKLLGEQEGMEVEKKTLYAGMEEVSVELKATEDNLVAVGKKKEDIQKEIEEKTVKVVGLDDELKTAKGANSEARADFKTLEQETKKLYEYVEQQRKEEAEEIAKFQEATFEAHKKESPVVHKMAEIEEWLNNKDDLPKDTRCSVCGNEITKESVEGCAEHYQKEFEKLYPQSQKLQEKRVEASEKEGEVARKWEKELKKSEEAKSALDNELNNQRDIIHKTESEMQRLENNAIVIKKEIEHLDSEIRERETLLLQTKERLEKKHFDYVDRTKELINKVTEIGVELEYLKFWIEGFSGKGIKSLLLDEILPQLNTTADYYGSVLLDNEIRMEFDTEAMLKSGDVRDKFNIKLFIGDEPVDYKLCSSGEKGRIDSAVLLALQNLIFERSDCPGSLMIFDEVFEHLDSIGIERMVNLLNEEAKDKAIFVISHQNEFADYFDNILMVEKKNGESRLVSE